MQPPDHSVNTVTQPAHGRLEPGTQCQGDEGADTRTCENVTGIVIADIDSRVTHQRGKQQRQETGLSMCRNQHDTNGEGGHRVIAGKRCIHAMAKQHVNLTGVGHEWSWSGPRMTDTLINQQSEAGADQSRHGPTPVIRESAYPANEEPSHDQRDEDSFTPTSRMHHQAVQRRMMSSRTVDPLFKPKIHCRRPVPIHRVSTE